MIFAFQLFLGVTYLYLSLQFILMIHTGVPFLYLKVSLQGQQSQLLKQNQPWILGKDRVWLLVGRLQCKDHLIISICSYQSQ